MLTLHFIRDHRDQVIERLQVRNIPVEQVQALVDDVIQLDDQRKSTQQELDQLLAANNAASKEIGLLYKTGKRAEADQIKTQVATNKEKISELQGQMSTIKTQLETGLLNIPNVPHQSVPKGLSDAENEVVKDWTNPLPQLDNTAEPHWELAKKYQLIDFELGVKIT
ncbi:MAG: serine--tRNA ligase, partial [Bacteroidota bacterium]